jgi:hypothetical protein
MPKPFSEKAAREAGLMVPGDEPTPQRQSESKQAKPFSEKAAREAGLMIPGDEPSFTPVENQQKLKQPSGGYKSGGKVKSASKRADGCCIRGKTRA